MYILACGGVRRIQWMPQFHPCNRALCVHHLQSILQAPGRTCPIFFHGRLCLIRRQGRAQQRQHEAQHSTQRAVVLAQVVDDALQLRLGLRGVQAQLRYEHQQLAVIHLQKHQVT